MKVKYVGPQIGATGLYDGETYNVSEIEEFGALRVVDEDKDNWNWDNRPDWLPGYLYSPTEPKAFFGEYKGGKFYIVEDDENGSLAKLGVLPLPDDMKAG